ncbi:PepSY-associated TM helix domain-containing protein [Aeromonas lusitana]|uniref:Peptidase n=1 Tax=Aeromonas lusitana TaxID=931529 RepID=A0A2M8HDB0_9GAMM|nr:PepSY-associated TM helix domain-containing protein [Aeromonas lusitana]PJC94543.1 peptidase [Aeromonas lusitana]
MKTKKLPLHNNKWVRRIHAWAGFATLALMLIYGLTGLWLQHRAVLPLPGPHTDKQSETLTLTAPLVDPAALTTLLQQHYSDGLAEARTNVTPPQILPTPNGTLTLPARWELKGVSLSESLAASYVVGTLEVRIERQQANLAASLNRLHRGMGTGLSWQLMGDLAALALLLLALTSLLMWNKLHGPSRRGITLLLGGALATLLIALL